MAYEFKGFDWNELADCWGIEAEDNVDLIETVKKYMSDSLIWNETEGLYTFNNPSIRMDIVNFLNKLADVEEHCGYNSPAFRGIASIETDETLVNWMIRNLDAMWV